jgi:hypothetical protein
MAFGLMLVLEGILPFMAPEIWRRTFRRLIDFSDGQLRFMGLASMLGGLIMIIIINNT